MVGPTLYDVVLEGPNILHNLVEFKLLVVFHVIYGMLWVVKDTTSRPLMEESRHAGVGFEYVLHCRVILFTLVLPIFSDICPIEHVPIKTWKLDSKSGVVSRTGYVFSFCCRRSKFYTKVSQATQLITEGLFRYTRNPNYLKVMIYVGYAFWWIYVHYFSVHGRMDASIFTKHVT